MGYVILEDILEDTDNLVNSIWPSTQLVAVVVGVQALFGIREGTSADVTTKYRGRMCVK